tara:strand:- start:4494 stop:5168 length:675 start_codon:yes stop_codon:yes gene_type:complete
MPDINNVELNVLEQTNIVRIKSVLSKEQCAKITKQIIDYKNSNNPAELIGNMNINANIGCWRGKPHFHNGFSEDISMLLIDTIRSACQTYYEMQPSPANISQNIYAPMTKAEWDVWAWVNVNDIGSENREHTHLGDRPYMCGVIYFQAAGTGRIEFMPYNYTYKIVHQAWPYNGVAYYEPEDGDVLLFPPYLLHRVERNNGNQQRVNISFNATTEMNRTFNAGY